MKGFVVILIAVAFVALAQAATFKDCGTYIINYLFSQYNYGQSVSFCESVLRYPLTRDGGSKAGKFTKVSVSGCAESDVDCILLRNTKANITIEFESAVPSTSLTTVVHGHVLGLDMPFPLANPDACAAGVQCPLQSGSSYEYTASLDVLKSYPKVKVTVKWELQDQNGDDVVCVEIPARIK